MSERDFDRLRALGIAAPGADEIRRTLRRRRTRATLAVVAFAVAMLGASVALLVTGWPGRIPATVRQDPEALAVIAQRAVRRGAAATELLAYGGRVREGFSVTHREVLGELRLDGACAGEGALTLVVRGNLTLEGGGGTLELTRLPLHCTARPAANWQTFSASHLRDFTIELNDAGTAVGRAGFAFRVTTDAGRVVDSGDDSANASAALHLPDPLPPGSHWGSGVSGVAPGREFAEEPRRLPGRNLLAIACTGNGTLHLRIRVGAREVRADIPCSYRPERRDVRLGRTGGQVFQVRYRYESATTAGASYVYQLLPD